MKVQTGEAGQGYWQTYVFLGVMEEKERLSLLVLTTSTLLENRFQRLEKPELSNKSCHPNTTALVGNWLTGMGKVVEVVKVR